MKFKCQNCSNEKEIYKTTTVYRDGEWIVKESLCENCGKYMKEVLTKEHGMPSLIRTEPTLRKK